MSPGSINNHVHCGRFVLCPLCYRGKPQGQTHARACLFMTVVTNLYSCEGSLMSLTLITVTRVPSTSLTTAASNKQPCNTKCENRVMRIRKMFPLNLAKKTHGWVVDVNLREGAHHRSSPLALISLGWVLRRWFGPHNHACPRRTACTAADLCNLFPAGIDLAHPSPPPLH